jgi:hypothetical protein
MARNVFIALGGTGTKVAQALVNWLSLGLPFKFEEAGDGLRNVQGYCEESDALEIWRIDPDGACGAEDSLQAAVKNYRDLQSALGSDASRPGSSLWTLPVHYVPAQNAIDPTQIAGGKEQFSTARDIMRCPDGEVSSRILNLFYTAQDLDVDLRSGLYQKAFLGSALFQGVVERLDEDHVRAKAQESMRIFICGSLFGGTGASGIPVLAQRFMRKKQREKHDWVIGGCVLGPYFMIPTPKMPELPKSWKALGEGVIINDLLDRGMSKQEVDDLVAEVCRSNPGRPEAEVRKILGGYYADMAQVKVRAAASLAFYSDEQLREKFFDRLYLVGDPTEFTRNHAPFSNGGRDQKNPSFAHEYVAALAAADFFSAAGKGPLKGDGRKAFVVPVSSHPLEALRDNIRFSDLPRLGNGLRPDHWLLAAAALRQLCFHQSAHIGDYASIDSKDYDLLEKCLKPENVPAFKAAFDAFAGQLGLALQSFMEPEAVGGGSQAYAGDYQNRTVGWSADDREALRKIASLSQEIHESFFGAPETVLTLGGATLLLGETRYLKKGLVQDDALGRHMGLATKGLNLDPLTYFSFLLKSLYSGVAPSQGARS